MSDLIDRQVALKALADLRDEAKRSGLALAMLNRAIIAIRSLPGPVEVTGWEPIESAPKDGTFVLLKIEYSENPVVANWVVNGWSASTEDYETSCGTYCRGGMPTMAKHAKPIGWRHLPS